MSRRTTIELNYRYNDDESYLRVTFMNLVEKKEYINVRTLIVHLIHMYLLYILLLRKT